MITFLWLASDSALQLQTRKLSLIAHSFVDASHCLNLIVPLRSKGQINADTDFNDIPFSCPAARRVLPIPTGGNDRLVLVIGDEHSVLYSMSETPQSPRISRLSTSSGILSTTSPRANATRRSPQTDMAGNVGKRRKSSVSSKAGIDSGDLWEFRPVWRVRQGFGTVLA